MNLLSDRFKVSVKNIKTPVKINKFAKTHLILPDPSVFALLFDSFLWNSTNLQGIGCSISISSSIGSGDAEN